MNVQILPSVVNRRGDSAEIVTPKGKQARAKVASSQRTQSTHHTTPAVDSTARKAIVPFKLLSGVEPKESPVTPSCLEKTNTSVSSAANTNKIASQKKIKKGYKLLHIDFRQGGQGSQG